MWMVGLLAFALVAAACGDSDSETTTTASTGDTTATTAGPAETTAPPTTAPPTTTTASNLKPVGGTVVTSNAQEPPTLNSFVPGGDNFIVSIVGNGYARGVQRVSGFDQTYIPDLVTELPTVANGGVVLNDDGTMTVSYTILDEAKWSDGTDLTGDDFQFTLDTIMRDDLPVSKAQYEDIVSTEVGTKTFSYTMAAPTTLFETMFSEIIPKHAIEGSNFLEDWNTTRWPSNGPFVFSEWQPGEFIRLTRNPNYFLNDPETGQALPYLDEVIIQFIPDTEAELNAFRARETDVVQPDPDTGLIQELQSLTPDGAVVEVLSGPIWEHLNFQFGPNNRNPESFNEYLDFRKAVAHAIDKDLIVDEILAGQVEPLTSWVEAYNPLISNSPWAQYDYDPETAAAYLADACEAAGRDCAANPVKVIFSTTSNNTARARLAELFNEFFTAIGIDYETDLEDSSLYFGDTLNGGTFDLGEWAWLGSPGLSGVVGILDIWDPENPCPEGDNCYQWGTEGSSVIDDNTARFAVLRDEANASVDEDFLVGLIQEAEQILADQVVLVPLYARLTVAAAWADEVGGFKHHPTSQGYTWNMEYWYRKDL